MHNHILIVDTIVLRTSRDVDDTHHRNRNGIALPLARVDAPVGPLLLINSIQALSKRTSHHD
jgi:hypothetical protein